MDVLVQFSASTYGSWQELTIFPATGSGNNMLTLYI